MRLEGSASARHNAKRLRKAMTPPEISLWLALRRNDLDLRFRRQHAANGYVLDFYCAPARLAIEVDGEAHNRGDRPMRDAVRDGWLATRSVHVLRFSAPDVLSNLDGVVREIMTVALERRDRLASLSPSAPSVRLRLPPPPGGGGLDRTRSLLRSGGRVRT